jgi:YbbR domain-containing protein
MSAYREIVVHRSAALFVKHILRKVFLEDWALKLIALFITLALWYGVAVSSKKGTATTTAQLAFRVPNDVVLISAGVQEVAIRVAGDDQKIDQLLASDIRVTADLTQVGTGDQILELTPQNVSVALPTGIKLEDIQPSRIAVKLEAVEEKDVPVKVATVGDPAPGYEIYSTVVIPAKVRVSGPESFMATLESLPTGAVDIAKTKSNVTIHQVPVTISNPKVTVFNTVVDVTVEIGERRIERSFVLSAAGKRVIATLYGPRSLLTKLKGNEIKVDIVKSDTGQESASVTLPQSLQGTVEVRDAKVQ